MPGVFEVMQQLRINAKTKEAGNMIKSEVVALDMLSIGFSNSCILAMYI